MKDNKIYLEWQEQFLIETDGKASWRWYSNEDSENRRELYEQLGSGNVKLLKKPPDEKLKN